MFDNKISGYYTPGSMTEEIRNVGIYGRRPQYEIDFPNGMPFRSIYMNQIKAVLELNKGSAEKSVIQQVFKENGGRTRFERFIDILNIQVGRKGGYEISLEGEVYRMTSITDLFVPCFLRKDQRCIGSRCPEAPGAGNMQSDPIENKKLRDDLLEGINEILLSRIANAEVGLAGINRDPRALLKDRLPANRCYKTIIFAQSKKRLASLFAASLVRELDRFVIQKGEEESAFWQRITPITNHEKIIFRSVMNLRDRGILNRQNIKEAIEYYFSDKSAKEIPDCAAQYIYAVSNTGIVGTAHHKGSRTD